MKPSTVCTLIVAWLSASASAHNNLFLPGDAYFSAELPKGFFDNERAPGDLELEYHRYAGGFMSCGYAGYENLVVTGVPESVLVNLREVHRVLYKNFSPGVPRGADVAELKDGYQPAFPLFVYNRNFPLSSPLGVKYNEAWAEVQTAEAMMRHAIYDDLGGIDFVIDDWASAREIAPLAIADGRGPMVTELGETGIVSKPVEVDAKAVMFVVLAGADVASFARREEGLVFFVVTDALKRYRFNREGVAMPQMIDSPADDIAAKRRAIQVDQVLLRSAIDLYALNHAGAPTKKQGLAALWKKPQVDCPSDWMATLREQRADPWGREYQWDGDVIFSLGADGVESKDDVVERFELGADVLAAPSEGP